MAKTRLAVAQDVRLHQSGSEDLSRKCRGTQNREGATIKFLRSILAHENWKRSIEHCFSRDDITTRIDISCTDLNYEFVALKTRGSRNDRGTQIWCDMIDGS